MPLSWNEIKSRAATFSKKWELESSEDAEAKNFRDDFFNVFGISRRRGGNLGKAYKQAKDYFPGLKEKELPRYILVRDFSRLPAE